MSEDVLYSIIHLYSVFTASLHYYIDSAERFDGTFQYLIGL